MILLEQIRLASPCPASWAEMEGTEQVRFCRGCRKNVYNVSAMTREEAEALVTRLEGNLCARFYRRADGTLLTRDCAVGRRTIRFRLAKKRSYAAALLLACGAGLLHGAGPAAASRARVKPGTAPKHVTAKGKTKPRVFVMGGMVAPPRPMPPPLVPPSPPPRPRRR